MMRELRRAIDPSPGLAHAIHHWPRIAQALRQPQRKRRRQQAELSEEIAGYDGFR